MSVLTQKLKTSAEQMRHHSNNSAAVVNLSRSKPGSRFAAREAASPPAASLLEKEILDEPRIRLVTRLVTEHRRREAFANDGESAPSERPYKER